MLAKQSLYLIQLHTLWRNEVLFACLFFFFSFAMCFRFLFSTSPNLLFPKIVSVSFINRNVEIPSSSRWSCKAEVQAQNCLRSSFVLPYSQFLPDLYSKAVWTTSLQVLLSLERRIPILSYNYAFLWSSWYIMIFTERQPLKVTCANSTGYINISLIKGKLYLCRCL